MNAVTQQVGDLEILSSLTELLQKIAQNGLPEPTARVKSISDPNVAGQQLWEKHKNTERLLQLLKSPEVQNALLSKLPTTLVGSPLTADMMPELNKATKFMLLLTKGMDGLVSTTRELLNTHPTEEQLQRVESMLNVAEELANVMPFIVKVLEQTTDHISKPAVRKHHEKGADAFAKLDGLGRFSNSHFVGDHLGAQLQKDTWEKNTQGQMALRKKYPNGGVSTALIRALDETDAMNEQLQQQVLERLGAFTADVTLAVIATMCDPRNKEFPLREPVLVTTDRILEYKKFQQRGERREEMERQVEQAMKDIQRLHLDFDRVKVDKREAVTIRNEQLFYAKEFIREQQLVDGTWIVVEKGWKVTPGMWQNEFLNPAQRLWFSHGARAIMELSHSDKRPVDQLAKLLWITLLVCPTGTWHLDEPRIVDIEPLLQRIGVWSEPDSRDKNWYRELRETFDDALDKLVQMGALLEWHYLPGCPPRLDTTPGVAQRWLESKLSFTDPAAVPAKERGHLPDVAQRRAALEDRAREARAARKSKGYKRKPKAQAPLPMPEPKGTITAAELKQWRNERGIQQSEMARRLGVSQRYFSYMERGERAITAELTQKLRAMMDSPEPD